VLTPPNPHNVIIRGLSKAGGTTLYYPILGLTKPCKLGINNISYEVVPPGMERAINSK
jgi:hypothetical protein